MPVVTTRWVPNIGAQERAWNAFYSQLYRFILLEGGFRSGKTWSGARMMADALAWNRCVDGLAAGTTYQLIDEVMIPELDRACFERGLRPKVHSSKRVIELRSLRNPRSKFNRHATIKCRSAERAQRIEGIEVGVIWADERGRWPRFPQDPKRDGPKQLKGRLSDLRARYAIQIDTGTPEGTATSTFEEYHEKPTAKHARFTMPTTENRSNLQADFIEGLRLSYDAETLQQYEQGIPTDVGVGFAYADCYTALNKGETQYRPDAPLYICLDFNVALLPLIYGQPQGAPPLAPFHVLGEVVEYGGARTEDVVDEFCRRMAHHRGEIHVFGDATGKRADTRGNLDDWLLVRRTLNRHFGEDAVVWCVQSSNPFVRQRVRRVRAMLSAGDMVRLVVDPETAPVLDKDLRAVRWKGDELDKRDELLTHASDAFGYMAHLRYPPPAMIVEHHQEFALADPLIDPRWTPKAGSRDDPFQPNSGGVRPW